VPSSQHGSACGGDSGSGVFPYGTDTVIAVHTGGYNLGWEGQICGRITSLNHRVDLPEILDWISGYLD
jgi:V8-like Glu-specific endopeptidase